MTLDHGTRPSVLRRQRPDSSDFPQLEAVMDPRQVATRLRDCWGLDAGDEIVSCSVDRLYYRHGQSCRLVYRVVLRRAGAQGTQEQWLFGRIGHARTAPPLPGRLATPAIGPACFRIDEWDLDVWAFPNDPEVPGVSLLFDPEQVLERFRRQPRCGGGLLVPCRATAELVRHVAGKRCSARMRLETDGDADARAWTVFAKVYQIEEAEAAFDRMIKLWESAPRRAGEFLMPEPYAYDTRYGIVWQEALAGTPLGRDPVRITRHAEEIGARLAGFHRAEVSLPRALDFDAQLQWLDRAAACVRSAYAEVADACAQAVDRLRSDAPRDEAGFATVVHASFKSSHIVETPRGLAFIDLDGAGLGDPAADLARWIAHVRSMARRGRIDRDTADDAVERFIGAYRSSATRPLSRRRIDWFAECQVLAGAMDKMVKRMDSGALRDAERIARGVETA